MRNRLRFPGAVAFLLACFVAGCARPATVPLDPPYTPTRDFAIDREPFVLTGDGTLKGVRAALCPKPVGSKHEEASPHRGEIPAPSSAIAEVAHQVELARGLDFEYPVGTESVSDEEMEERIRDEIAGARQQDLLTRRQRALATIGVIDQDVDLAGALEDMTSGGVVGYYDPETEELVYIGEDDPSAYARYVLAHELTHALDDQHFDLMRIDSLFVHCRDELTTAAIAAVEGSAELSAGEVLQRFFDSEDMLSIASEGLENANAAQVAAEAPPFLFQELLFSYQAGARFSRALQQEGGRAAVDRSLKRLPVSTEQILHPEKYPNDVPQQVDVPDLGMRMGKGWTDLDVADVGEDWLSRMLRLRLPSVRAASAAAGWDGGLYRAWSRGEQTLVALTTIWDTQVEAKEFADALQEWSDPRVVAVSPVQNRVSVLFASDPATLEEALEVLPRTLEA